jgi:hypothetical protein
MKYIIILTSFLVISYCNYAQDTSFVKQEQLNELGQRTANLSDSVSQISGSVTRLQQGMQPGDFAAPQGLIDSLKKDPCVLYLKPICKMKWIYQVGGWILFALIMVGGIFLFATTSICRDESLDVNGKLKPLKERPYSYARVQLFWWTMIILSCYVTFFAMYGNLVPLNMTTVLLLGLASTVYAGGKILDERQKKQNPTGTRNQDKNASEDSFLTDMLSDDSGISIHRFQTLVFNIVFGIGFISYFVSSHCAGFCRYPFLDLNDWQFALLGISSATYLGLKAAENNPDTPPPPPPVSVNNPPPDPPTMP